ncbi:DUF6530 family protein [uncultured Sphingomonas sp.]|uniref:DUF6530 family protein n=1 Tax=uncultured Sphingomonas sp. TaxID=158754 RepID=UPI0035CC7DA2
MATTQLPFPHQIAHSPVYGLPYNAHDPDREGNSDAHWLTIGWAQWDEDEAAAKVVRHSGERWSRQSEEVPVSRLVDLTTLLAKVYQGNADQITFEADFFENQPEEVTIKAKSSRSREALAAALHRDPKLRRRLANLADVMIALREARQV